MSNDSPFTNSDEMGKALEKSFRKAVSESKKHGYVSVMDRPKNSTITLAGASWALKLKKTAKKTA